VATLLLADDHALVGQTLAAYLQGQGVAQVSVACDVDTALELISQFGSFDLALVDYNMPGMNGLHGFVRILEANGGRPVALISGALSAELADQALQAGAAGVVPKTLGAKALRDAVLAMLDGQVFAPLSLLSKTDGAAMAALTPREGYVLRLMSQGQSNKEISLELDLQEVTVKRHMANLHRKLGAKNRTQAAMLARHRNLI
jgi:DNA-binding NarL/FixJ family response regulator